MPSLITTSKEVNPTRIFKALFFIPVSLIVLLWLLIDLSWLWLLIIGAEFNNPNVWFMKIWGLITLSLNAFFFWFLFKFVKTGRLKDIIAFIIVLVLVLVELYFYFSAAFI